jgi:hypothetical protein
MKDYTRRCLTAALGCAALCGSLAVPLSAQSPAPVGPARSFDHVIILGGDWLQANAMPLNRAAAQSVGGDISWRPGSWAINGGFIRIARDLSTVQGGTLSFGRVLRAGPVRFIPAVSLFGGEAYASVDTTGYNYASGTTTGHVPRYDYSSGFAYGGGGGLTLEVPVFSVIGIRGGASEWFFGGTPLDGDRSRTVVSVGLTLRVR